jgi:HEAT repeat protein
MSSAATLLVFQAAARAALYATAGLTAACIAFLLALLVVAMRRNSALRARSAASATVRPALQAALVEFLAGGTDDSLLRHHIHTHPADIAASMLLFQNTVGGSARDRLCALALDLGLVREWCAGSASRDVVRRRAAFANLAFAFAYEPCRRQAGDLLVEALNDTDEEVRLSACRGLALAGGEAEIEDLFELAIRPNLLTRIVLTEELRVHALTLATGPVREVLRSGDSTRVRAALEVLVAWERAIPLAELRDFLDSRNGEIRVLALRLASFVTVDSESRLALMRSLEDRDDGIRGLAMIAIGRQKMAEAIPELALCLQREDLEQARHAATALAAMPPEGRRILEELSASANPTAALAAGEALARAGTGA